MAGLRNKAVSLLRDYVTDRRRTARRDVRYEARLSFDVSVHRAGKISDRPGTARRTASLAGRTRDISEGDLTLVVLSIRIGGDYLTLEDNQLRITLALPSGPVELIVAPVRFEELAGDEGYLVGVRILEMSDNDRRLYAEHLRTLTPADRRRDTYRLSEA
ncbi:MAG: hypothetical protein LC747_04050 [Acidobacteria bacterium]|nr:hypothetical protein [Acidobacteriota bacterium]